MILWYYLVGDSCESSKNPKCFGMSGWPGADKGFDGGIAGGRQVWIESGETKVVRRTDNQPVCDSIVE